MTDERIQHAEIVEIFGDTIPIEAVNLLANNPDNMSIERIRERLREMAADFTEKTNMQSKINVLVKALLPFAKACRQVERDYGEDLPHHQCQFPEITMGDLRGARSAVDALLL